jgi:hypothetical protein
MAQVAVPIIASIAGGLASSSGSKKAAKNARPDIPGIFKGSVGQGLGLIGQRLGGGFPAFPGGAINPLQAMAMGQMGQSFGAGQAGLDSARQTIQSLAATGIDPAAINTANSQLSPYFDFLRQQGLAQTREGEAQGGRFFGSGAQTGEGMFMSNLAAQQSAQTLPLALQMSGLRLGAAQALPQQMAAEQGLGMNLFNTGGQAQAQQLQEFLRQQPDNAISLLASLMGGSPIAYNPIGNNFSQVMGANLGSMMGSSGFWNYLSGLGNRPGSSTPSPTANPLNPWFSGTPYNESP